MSKARVNMTKFTVGLVESLTKGAPKLLTKDAENIMAQTARQFVETEDTFWPHDRESDDPDHPWWSGHLHDSVAVRVTNAERNVAVAFMPKAASRLPQNNRDEYGERAMPNRDYDNIIGWQYGRLFYGRMSRMSSDALVSWLLIGVPYAETLEKEGEIRPENYADYTGFASRMHDRLYNTLHDQLKILGKKAYRLK